MPLSMTSIDRKSIGQVVQFRWNSVFSGAFSTLGIGLFFLMLGNAINLSPLNAIDPTVGGPLQIWSWLYTVVTLTFSYFVGAFLCTRTHEIKTIASGLVHGTVVWGLTSTITVFLAALISPSAILILQGVGSNFENWLVVAILGLGFCSSELGGMVGKQALPTIRITEDTNHILHKDAA